MHAQESINAYVLLILLSWIFFMISGFQVSKILVKCSIYNGKLYKQALKVRTACMHDPKYDIHIIIDAHVK